MRIRTILRSSEACSPKNAPIFITSPLICRPLRNRRITSLQPTVSGVVETALYVADLERAADFYQELFGFRVIHSENDRMRALSVADRQVLLLFRVAGSTHGAETPNGKIPPHDGQGRLHLAFAVAEDQLPSWRDWLRDKGVAIESEVDCGGHSLYFRDPDGHLLELISPGCWPIY